MNYQIDIDGFIGEWEYSTRYVKQKLNENKGKPVFLRMNSNGGRLYDGLSMCDRIQEHGDVTVHMMGFNASAATLATLKAKKICMASNGFYLIHKVMTPVGIWENLNADQMEALISELMADKLANDKIDQVLAQMYATKTGKTMEEMLALMKVGGWMNAKEAQEYGFIDEIIDAPEKVNMISMKEKLNVFGLPTNRINSENLFTYKITSEMKKQPIKINAVIGVEKLESDGKGVFLNEKQIEDIEANIESLEDSVETEKANVVTEKEATVAADTRANSAEATVATQATKITELETQITNLKNGAGDTTGKSKQVTDEDGKGEGGDSFSNTVESARKLYNLLPE